jgi:hypothetical protein
VINIFAGPTIPNGVVAVIDVGELKVTFVAYESPISTYAPTANPVPVIVTTVPPVVSPVEGVTEPKVGVEIRT